MASTASSPAKCQRRARLEARRKTHDADSTSPRTSAARGKELSIEAQCPIPLQQLLLDVFKNAFSTRFNEGLGAAVQEVKRNLYNRDFHFAFSGDAFLEAYATRWSPSRALAYLDIFLDLLPFRHHPGLDNPHNDESDRTHAAVQAKSSSQSQPNIATSFSMRNHMKIVCIGGGAGSELVALAGYLHRTMNLAATAHDRSAATHFNVTVVDIADWSAAVDKIYQTVTTNPPLSQYASASAKAANTPLVDALNYEVRLVKQDILNSEPKQMEALLKDVNLVTLMFTLNELYSTSIGAATNMLLSITSILAPDSSLLVVDSPGSYSTVSIGKAADGASPKAQKSYPMQWLLDHTLLEAASLNKPKGNVEGKQWEKVNSHDSKWFRLPSGLTYPIDLEDMRYQLHLYRRL